MMLKEKVQALLLHHLKYDPTQSQSRVISQLSDFLTDPEPASLFLLRGYAGTGKTTLVSSLVDTLTSFNIRTVLLAPTGRAAKVLSSYTGKQAFTIHKTIYQLRQSKEGHLRLVPAPNRFRRTLFIVDEASMIQDSTAPDGNLFSLQNVLDDLYHFVYEGDSCRMILIGDTAQLPPVGMDQSPALNGALLRSSYPLKLYEDEMTEVVRQAEGSGILSNATALRDKIKNQSVTLPLIRTSNSTDIEILTGYELQEALSGSGMYQNSGESVVITRSNKRANLFNQQIRQRILFREEELSAGDVLMVVRNNYFWLEPTSQAGFIANGDIMEVMRISGREERYGFHFADLSCSLVDYPDQPPVEVKVLTDTLHATHPALSSAEQQSLYEKVMEDYRHIPSKRKRLSMLRMDPYYNALQVKYAYAMTCHKTQGGQWPVVFIDQGYLTEDQIDISYLRWLYTAITRSTRKVYLVGFSESLIS